MNTTEYVMAMINELRNNSGTIAKQEIIAKYCKAGKEEDNGDQLHARNVLNLAHNDYLMYGLTSTQVKKRPDLFFGDCEPAYGLSQLFGDLKLGRYTGHDAIKIVNTYINKFPEQEELVYCILDKDLKTKVGVKLINKVIPDFIPEFSVALAEKYEPKLVDWDDEHGWFVSRKLDGVRCLAIVDHFGNTTFYSRTGKELLTLGVVADGITALELTDVVFDGELCLIDEDGNEDFQSIMKQLRRKDHTIENPSYKIFDMMTQDEFKAKKSDGNLYQRYKELLFTMENNECPCLSVLEMEMVDDDDHFQQWVSKADDNGWEGVMLRKNVAYKGKRSKDLLKVKTFHDDEYEVLDTEMGMFHLTLNGKECEEEMLSCVYIKHKDNIVRVGSGFSIEQRQNFYKNPDAILGKIITVQYFEETKNQDGGISLRFPTFKILHGEVRTV
tara:strand:- start:1412 stop:2737 length:1326 start_codon:yes stop_codon:yes gene_type:complete